MNNETIIAGIDEAFLQKLEKDNRNGCPDIFEVQQLITAFRMLRDVYTNKIQFPTVNLDDLTFKLE